MYVVCVTAFVKPENIDNFLAITRAYASQTRQEMGNIRYDVLQSDEDPTCFLLYEAYRSKNDFLIHRETAHSRQWKEEIEPWMARPRQRIRCNSILFGSE